MDESPAGSMLRLGNPFLPFAHAIFLTYNYMTDVCHIDFMQGGACTPIQPCMCQPKLDGTDLLQDLCFAASQNNAASLLSKPYCNGLPNALARPCVNTARVSARSSNDLARSSNDMARRRDDMARSRRKCCGSKAGVLLMWQPCQAHHSKDSKTGMSSIILTCDHDPFVFEKALAQTCIDSQNAK